MLHIEFEFRHRRIASEKRNWLATSLMLKEIRQRIGKEQQ